MQSISFHLITSKQVLPINDFNVLRCCWLSRLTIFVFYSVKCYFYFSDKEKTSTTQTKCVKSLTWFDLLSLFKHFTFYLEEFTLHFLKENQIKCQLVSSIYII